jgi:hypothetical protein
VRLTTGKLVALATYVVLAIVSATLIALAVGVLTARSSGIDSSAWFTDEGLLETAKGTGELVLAALGWGALGAILGLVLRSPTTAIAAGLAYALPVENLLAAAWNGGEQWLPGQLLEAVARGGTHDAPLERALLLTALGAIAGPTIATASFARRDVTV